MMKWAWFDNRCVLSSHRLIRGTDEGFLYGQGLFETMRLADGKVFLLEEHLDRLIASCPVVGLKAPSKRLLAEAVRAVIKKNRLDDAAIRLNVFKSSVRTSIFVFARKFIVPGAKEVARGFRVLLNREERVSPSALNNVKSLNHYFYNRLTQWANKYGCDEALFLNAQGRLVEGSRTNIFLVKGNRVRTPALSCGCLAGVTRAEVTRLLKTTGLSVRETGIQPRELFYQDEIFVTNSLIGVMPVTRLDGRPVGGGVLGAVTELARNMYEKGVEKARKLR